MKTISLGLYCFSLFFLFVRYKAATFNIFCSRHNIIPRLSLSNDRNDCCTLNRCSNSCWVDFQYVFNIIRSSLCFRSGCTYLFTNVEFICFISFECSVFTDITRLSRGGSATYFAGIALCKMKTVWLFVLQKIVTFHVLTLYLSFVITIAYSFATCPTRSWTFFPWTTILYLL